MISIPGMYSLGKLIVMGVYVILNFTLGLFDFSVSDQLQESVARVRLAGGYCYDQHIQTDRESIVQNREVRAPPEASAVKLSVAANR